GVYISQNRGFNYRKVIDLPNIQFYSCKIDPNDPDRLYGGTQDNGTNRTTTGSVDDWRLLTGGDGFGVNIDPRNSSVFYTQVQRGILLRTEDDGANFRNISFDPFGGGFNWNTPLKLDPFDNDMLYCGNQRLFRSLDRGENWTPISPSLVNANNPQGNLNFGTLTTIDVSPLDKNVIYVGTDDGNVWVSRDFGVNWNAIKAGIPNRWITRVTASPHQVGSVYLTVSGFRFGESSAQVFRSDNYGTTWIPIGAGLPDIPVNDIIVDPAITGLLYLGTDIGVYYSENNGNSWELLGRNLPEAPVTDLDFHTDSRTLAAATYGRSLYTYNLNTLTSTENFAQADQIKVYPNPSKGQISIETNTNKFKIDQVEVFDLNGKLVYQKRLQAVKKQELNLNLTAGNYWLQVRSDQGVKTSQKLIIL
ncbi:MAG: T9SS type A sorting domain-containing protein, partial [Bacteroidota bacterium]